MATVIVCDRCKNEVQRKGVYEIGVVTTYKEVILRWDVCDDCCNAIAAFVRNGVDDDNDKTK